MDLAPRPVNRENEVVRDECSEAKERQGREARSTRVDGNPAQEIKAVRGPVREPVSLARLIGVNPQVCPPKGKPPSPLTNVTEDRQRLGAQIRLADHVFFLD